MLLNTDRQQNGIFCMRLGTFEEKNFKISTTLRANNPDTNLSFSRTENANRECRI